MQKLDISGVHLELDDKLRKYAQRKIGKLDKYIAREQRPTGVKVVLSESRGNAKNRYVCEVIMDLPGTVITAKEATINIYAAIDIVEEKLKAQLAKYKAKHSPKSHRRRLRPRWRR